jgi:hypothetical protein
MESVLIAELVIPKYITKIELSKSRRKKYYKKGDDLPKKYQKTGFTFKGGFLVDPEGNRVIKNPRSAGTPKYEVLSGNKITSGYATPHIRAKIAAALKDFYRPHVRTLKPFSSLPLRVEWEFWTTVDPANFDMSNFWFYYKYFEDSLVREGIIPDDSIQFVTSPGAPMLVPVDNFEDRKFVFRFYQDDRTAIREHVLWKDHFKPKTDE